MKDGMYIKNGGTFNMYGGTISGNTATGYGGGVYVYTGGFAKSGNSIVYGSDAPTDALKNIVGTRVAGSAEDNTLTANTGHAAYVLTGTKKCDATADATVNLDSTKTAADGGGWDSP
jgi:hypothetical protein